MSDPIFIANANTPEWYATRNKYIGASEAAAACGLSEWMTPLELFARKRGQLPEIEDNDAMRMGRRLEPIIRDEFCHATGAEIEVYPCPMVRHPTIEFMSATPDVKLVGGELLECKATTWRMASKLGDEGSDFVPESWLCQVQQQMAVMGADVAHIAALIDGRTLRRFIVERNELLIHAIIEAETELWERIKNNDPPEPNWNHARTPDLIRKMHGCTQGETVRLGSDLQASWDRQAELAAIIKDAEAKREIERAKVLHAMGESEFAILPDDTTLSRIYVKGSHIEYDRKPYFMLKARAAK